MVDEIIRLRDGARVTTDMNQSRNNINNSEVSNKDSMQGIKGARL
jgi:hypothetical protein